MSVNRAVAPYYDDYDSSKQYTQLLAIPGRVAQAREITQIQSTVKDIIKSIGDSVMKNGDIIEGCQVIINTAKTEATITSGKVYLNGLVLPVPETKIGIDGVGTETIGFKLKETLITEAEDNTLRDPAQGYDNFNQPGCHRIKSTVSIVRNDDDAAVLVTLIDGAVSVEKYAPNYDVLTQTLARRTYDESGSYIVEGLNVRIEEYRADSTKFTVVIESGKAYILGYELKIPAPRRLVLPRAMTYSPVKGVLIAYDPSVSAYVLSNAPYVRNITLVKGSVQKTVNQSISSNTDRVLIDEVEGIQIVSVKQGSTEYTVGTANSGDCYLQREGTRYYLAWRGTENYPTLNASYSVVYNYTYTFVEGTDYKLSHNTTTDSHELVWLGATTPLANTNFTVDYNQYLARKDIIYINQYGDIAAAQGTPAEYGYEVAGSAPVNTLALASISSPPGGMVTDNVNTRIQVSNIGLTRFTMNDIQKLLNRIRTLEYDQSILSLNEEAKQYETTSTKRGIFTDPLIDFSKLDYYYNLLDGQKVNPELPSYDATLDLDSNICYLPTVSHNHDAVYDTNSTVAKHSRTVTLAKIGENVVLSQMNATKTFLVNPYTMFPQLPELSITPAVDTWIEESVITIPLSQTTTQVLNTSTRHVSRSVSSSSRGGTSTTSSTDEYTTIGVKSSTSISESVVSEQAITYIRPRTITVEGSLFPPNLNDIKCYFDGILTPLTPLGDTVAGSAPGSIKSDAAGNFTAEFTIPDKILTGIREVRLESDIETEGFINSAFALYQASGTRRNIQRTVTALTTVLMNRVTTITTTRYTTPVDPVGQTFVLDRMTMISGIDLYFEGKPDNNTPVSCEIREVVNGNITATVYGHKSLPASEVNISSDSKTATRFTFDDPVLLEENKEYAFVVRSTSPSYRVWVANLGENDIITGDPVLTNPYLIGVMMSSSNNSSWTTHQTTDVKFRLVEDIYSDSAEVLFQEMNEPNEFSRLYFLADSVIPDGTSVSWSYSTDSGVTYQTISPYNMTVLDYLGENVIFKARLAKTPTANLSPIVATDTVGAVLSKYDLEGCYITKNITGLDKYTNVDVVLDTYNPNGTTSLDVYVDNGDGTLRKATLSSNTRTLNYNWKENTYKITVPESTQCRVFIKLHSTHEYFTPAFRKVRVIMS